MKSLKRLEAKKLLLSLLLGFCIGVLACVLYLSVYSVKQQLSLVDGVWNDPVKVSSNNNSTQISSGRADDAESIRPSGNGDTELKQNSSSTENKAIAAEQLEHPRETQIRIENVAEDNAQRNISAPVDPVQVRSISAPVEQPNYKEEPRKSRQPDGRIKAKEGMKKPICDLSWWRTDVCEMTGDVRIHGKSSAVVFVNGRRSPTSWKIKPYARKFDKAAMQHVTQVTVTQTPSRASGDAPRCVANYTAPAMVFVIGGYTGNYYHDYTDVLIPLFITARQFAGDVHFLIYTRNFWWIDKYRHILKQLSRHDIVFLDGDDQVRCFPRAIVGLHSHKPMSIDPARAPGGYSMVDFTAFLRTTYSLERASPVKLGEGEHKKPRMLLIPRKSSRKFTNFEQIVALAEGLGFEVVTGEAGTRTDLASFARVLNSCDVMVGVHGAGLTNFVYLPTNAVIVQIIPFGNLVNISRSCFKDSSQDAGLRYVDYSIAVEESSLIERYPRNHPVFVDPKSIHRLGWNKMGEVYLDNQDVKLDLHRFKPVLLKVMELLHQ